jgi:hypothetical protein
MKSDPLQPWGRCDIPFGRSIVHASSIQMTRTFRPDLPLCWEASNCSILHLSESFSSTSGHHSVFELLWDFFPNHRYGKIAATVRTMWIPVRRRSSIRQVVHSKFRRPDDCLHGLDARASYMEIACIKFTVLTTDVMVWTLQDLICKLRRAKVQPSRWQGNTVRTRLNSRNNFYKIWKANRTVVRPDALCLPSKRGVGISSQTLIWTYSL